MKNRMGLCLTAAAALLGLAWMATPPAVGAHKSGTPGATAVDAFRQLDEVLPTPSATRTASGAPGPAYWQQQVDYEIAVTIDDEKRQLRGEETITYTNNSV